MKNTALSAALLAAAVAGFMAGQVQPFSPAHAAGPAADQLAAEINTLKTRLTQLEARSRSTPTAAVPATDSAVAALQKDVGALMQALQVSGNSVALKSPGSLTIQAGGAVAIAAASQATLDAGSGLKLRSAASLDLESGKVDLKASGSTTIQSAKIVLNGGSRPVAFLGGKTAGSTTSQLIAEGSATVLVP